MSIPTILREAEHTALQRVQLRGQVLDLGGDSRSAYRSHIRGDFRITTLNHDKDTRPDILHDLEHPLPIENERYDHALLINVLEHIFAYRQLLEETVRILRPGGSVVLVVPFLFPFHPSPRDFWRFSSEALVMELTGRGLKVERIETLGTGVFAARFVMIDRLLPGLIRAVAYPFRPLISFLDRVFARAARVLGKKYTPSDYALGFMVIARKQA